MSTETNTVSKDILDGIGIKLVEAVTAVTSIPPDRRLWDKKSIGVYFDVSSSTVERIIAQPKFPSAIKIPAGPLRWKAAEIMDWAENQNGKRASRS
ncbi:helix-turn-helix transcriptional regulator [Uliginosibacterium gangwonense]|uniref:helix-turn-helix transcriptional regulator n=1 Tax=Uliginosibacterium gangwonense TaxID=392736 RepID=UPI00037D19E1|nr:hypothetical protein [Uliginosibacterium gangwonense]